MASGGDNSRNGIIAGINVTPLVDITLVLLIIFIVTAKIMVAPAVPMDLPRSSQSKEVQVVLSILLPKEGPILVNGSAVADDATLTERAKQALVGQPEGSTVPILQKIGISIDGPAQMHDRYRRTGGGMRRDHRG